MTDQPVDRSEFIKIIAAARDVTRECERLMITTEQAVDALMPYLTKRESCVDRKAVGIAHEKRRKNFYDCDGMEEASTFEIIEWYEAAKSKHIEAQASEVKK